MKGTNKRGGKRRLGEGREGKGKKKKEKKKKKNRGNGGGEEIIEGRWDRIKN